MLSYMVQTSLFPLCAALHQVALHQAAVYQAALYRAALYQDVARLRRDGAHG